MVRGRVQRHHARPVHRHRRRPFPARTSCSNDVQDNVSPAAAAVERDVQDLVVVPPQRLDGAAGSNVPQAARPVDGSADGKVAAAAHHRSSITRVETDGRTDGCIGDQK